MTVIKFDLTEDLKNAFDKLTEVKKETDRLIEGNIDSGIDFTAFQKSINKLYDDLHNKLILMVNKNDGN
jgi:hypothetical protein